VVYGQAPPQAPAPAETIAPDIPGVVAAGTKVTLIKEGFQGTEGPIAAPDGTFLFTETQASQITRIDANGSTSVYMENTNGSNGLAFDAKGRLISVQTVKPLVGVLAPTPSVLADSFEGQPFGRPNDLTVAKNGGVYFTDPNAKPPAVYYIRPAGGVVRIANDIERPNGILLSPDEKILYVANTNGEHVLAYDVQPDGSVRNRRNFAALEGIRKTETGVTSGADGLAVDAAGRLYVASAAGVQVFSPQGARLGTIPIGRPPQNIAFAGPAKKTLYIVGRGAAYKVDLLAEGFKGRAK
jgi:gluconolactonase